MSHRCAGDGCGICEAQITAAEVERDFPEPYEDQGGEAQHERHLDRLGGDA